MVERVSSSCFASWSLDSANRLGGDGGSRLGLVWQRSDVGERRWPRNPKARYWNKRRVAGWWAVTCAALTGLLALTILIRAAGSVLDQV